MKYKKAILFSLIFILLVSFTYAEESSSSINWLSLGHAKQIFCQLTGICTVSDLTVTGTLITPLDIYITNSNKHTVTWNVSDAEQEQYDFTVAGVSIHPVGGTIE